MKHDPVDDCRFFTAEDACRLALSAYYAAGHALSPPAGQSWFIDGEPYALPSDFADEFCQQVADRVSALAYSQHLRCTGPNVDGPWWPNNEDELTQTSEVRLRQIMQHLPPQDNPGNNQAGRKRVNG